MMMACLDVSDFCPLTFINGFLRYCQKYPSLNGNKNSSTYLSGSFLRLKHLVNKHSNDNLVIVIILFVIKNASSDNNHLRLGAIFSSYYKKISSY